MRRKSTRNKAKNEEEEEVEKVARRSNRTRRRKKSESTSPDRDSESEEEVMPTPRTRRAVRSVSEERTVPSTPGGSRTRRSSRRIENIPEETKPNEPSPDPEETADRDSNGSNGPEADTSTVWKVQNSNGSGSGIAKLKLCRSGPIEEPEVAAAPRRGRGPKHQREVVESQPEIMVVEDDTSQTIIEPPAQASPTPEPDSSGLAAKPGQVSREEEESKEESTSSEKSRSPTPSKEEQDSAQEEEERKSAKQKDVKWRKARAPSPEKKEVEEEDKKLPKSKVYTQAKEVVKEDEKSTELKFSVGEHVKTYKSLVEQEHLKRKDVDVCEPKEESQSRGIAEGVIVKCIDDDSSSKKTDVTYESAVPSDYSAQPSESKVMGLEIKTSVCTEQSDGTTPSSASEPAVLKVDPPKVDSPKADYPKPDSPKSVSQEENLSEVDTSEAICPSSKKEEVESVALPEVEHEKCGKLEEPHPQMDKTESSKAEASSVVSETSPETSGEMQVEAGLVTKSTDPSDAAVSTEKTAIKNPEPVQEEEEQSDDEPLVELAPGSPDEPDPEMAEAEAVEAEQVEKARQTRKSRHRARSSSSRSRSSSSESVGSHDRIKRQRQPTFSGSEDSEDTRNSPQKRPRVRNSAPVKQQSSNENRKVETAPPANEPVAPPTRLRRKQMSPKPPRERIVLRRTFSDRRESAEELEKKEEAPVSTDKAPEPEKMETEEDKENLTNHSPQEEEPSASEQPVVRKRRWGSSKSIMKKTVLCISSDPLKNLIPDAKPVPANEVHLSPEEEEGEVIEDEEKAADHGRGDERLVVDRPLPPPQVKPVPPPQLDSTRIVVNTAEELQGKATLRKISIVNDSVKSGNLHSSTFSKHRPSCVLYITNLVRPFTVGQLKELLSRTGKIVEGGFWINGIKSQCYVEYEDEDQAIETRHALHGVRWPISNRKELQVEFAKKEDMEKAQAQAEAELAALKKVPQVSDGIARDVRDLDREERTLKAIPAVREWDLGKVQDPMGIVDVKENRQEERRKREEERRVRKEKRSSTPTHDAPPHKVKKKEEEPAPPVKLLDDLFRKTKTTPCIYWLPLTAEQIAEKEEMRRKHMAQHERLRAEMRKAHERNHGREREREKERDRDKERERDRDRERERRDRRRGSREK